jgi:hypothetical protein
MNSIPEPIDLISRQNPIGIRVMEQLTDLTVEQSSGEIQADPIVGMILLGERNTTLNKTIIDKKIMMTLKLLLEKCFDFVDIR